MTPPVTADLLPRYSEQDPPAPVNGGIRWRKPHHAVFESCYGKQGFTIYDPDEPQNDPEDAEKPEIQSVNTLKFVTAPPEEARAGEEYAYQAKAFDSAVGSFTWSIKKGPPGMKVDRYSGLVQWTPEEGGYVEILLHAHSLYGVGSDQAWTIRVHRARQVQRIIPTPRFSRALRHKHERTNGRRHQDRLPPVRVYWRKPGSRTVTPQQTAAPPEGRFRAAAVPLRI